MNKKRIGAVIALLFIAGLYLAALVLAFIDNPFARSCLMAALFCTIVVPAILYAYLMLIRFLKPKERNGAQDAGEVTDGSPTNGIANVTNGSKNRKD